VGHLRHSTPTDLEVAMSGRIHPRVRLLARDLGAPKCIHLTKEHQQDWLRAFARDIQVTIDSWMKGELDDRTWPFQYKDKHEHV
jgi:hypothetical protein